jgi:UDP-N-acetylmuramoyl-tripeptide--D-alanyl-D-alanine ligase
MSILSIKEIGALFGAALQDERIVSTTYVDGRLCTPGGLYFALKGRQVDGHDFLAQAASLGAIGAVVQENYQGAEYGLGLIRVKNPLAALHTLAKHVIEMRKPLIIGVTGSIGKTTVKEFIASLLAVQYRVGKSPSSYNGQIGLPLTLINADPKAEVLVVEMGMSEKNEMDCLVDIAAPHYAVITRIAPAHIGNFSSLEEIAYEKAKLLRSRNLRIACVHSVNHHYAFIRKQEPQVTYSGTKADAFFIEEQGQWVLIDQKRKEKTIMQLPFTERHLMENFLVAALVAREMGVSYEVIAQTARQLKPFTHRFEKISLSYPPRAVIVDDSYNNNPVSLKTSLQNLPKPQGGKTIAVIGEMRELGNMSKMAHTEIGFVALPIVDCLICYGVEARPIYEVFIKHHKLAYHFLEKKEVLERLQEHLQEGDVALIKGANSNKLWELIAPVQESSCR